LLVLFNLISSNKIVLIFDHCSAELLCPKAGPANKPPTSQGPVSFVLRPFCWGRTLLTAARADWPKGPSYCCIYAYPVATSYPCVCGLFVLYYTLKC